MPIQGSSTFCFISSKKPKTLYRVRLHSILLNYLSIFATDFVPSKKTIPLTNR